MNYIRHLTAFYEKLASDKRFTPSHVSFYLALFQCWNMNHFENPFSINRNQVLKYCKIGSNHTYYKVLKELHTWGYIRYDPVSSGKGASIIMCIFAPDEVESDTKSGPSQCNNVPSTGALLHTEECKSAPGTGAKMHPSLKYINTNNKREREKNDHTQILENDDMNFKKQQELFRTENFDPEFPERKKVAPKKEKENVPSNLDEVLNFFKHENYPELEGRKFFNHFQSNGWKVGGKAPMKDWQAAANKWMLNSRNFSPRGKPDTIHLNKNKNYNKPL